MNKLLLKGNGFNVNVGVSYFDKRYYRSEVEYLNSYGLILSEFLEYIEIYGNNDFLSFLKHSVENNDMLNDSLNEIKIIKNDKDNTTIYYEIDGNNKELFYSGIFTFDNYSIFTNTSYFIINDRLNKKSYFYYTD